MKSPLSPLIISVGSLLSVSLVQGIQVDNSFQATVPNGTVHAIALAPDSSVWIGGEFDSVNGQNVRSLAKLNSSGVVDPSTGISINGAVFTLAFDSAGKLVAGGTFGIASTGWLLPADGRVLSLAVGPNGNVIAGGSFWSQPDVFVCQLRTSGAVDPAFKSGLKLNLSLEAGANVVAVQPDGKILVGGNFDTATGFTSLARLNANGSVDSSFCHKSGPLLYPKALVILANGKILVGGTADSSGRGFVRQLNSDGSVDTNFAEVACDQAVEALAVDSVGRVIVGGSFTHLNAAERPRLARLDAQGNFDASWDIGANNVVEALVVDPDGAVFVGGAFSELGGSAHSGIARLHEINSVASSAQANLSLAGTAGLSYMIESSTDLITWSEYRRDVAGQNGLSIRATTTAGPRLFFRARPVE
jgi:uncharacterized delta-60 repeat protein